MTPHGTGHGLPTTTHTLEMAQVDDLNLRLANSRSAAITAAEIGMGGAHLTADADKTLAGGAVLSRVSWQGSPEFPTIHGHFGAPAGEVSADLHTAALREISRRLLLRQRWGI